jgi:phage shock protein C
MFNIHLVKEHLGGCMAEIPLSPEGGDGKLYRSKENRMLFGVCGGIGEYYNIDPTIVRIIWVIFSLIYLVGVLAYLVAVLIIPEEPQL